MSGNWNALDANMALYRFHIQKICGYFEGCEFHHVPRADNEAVEMLSKLGSSRQAIPPGIALEHLRKPSITPSPECESIYIPANPRSRDAPMDIDWGNTLANLGNASVNLGTASQNLGTVQPNPAEVMPVDRMEVDEDVFLVRAIPAWALPIF